jgi:hypothetical protein
VIFQNRVPTDVPGWSNLEKRRAELAEITAKLKSSANGTPTSGISLGNRRVFVGDIDASLAAAGLQRETLTDHPGLLFIRRTVQGQRQYFLNNRGEAPFDGWLPLAANGEAVAVLDPMTGRAGFAPVRKTGRGQIEVRLQIDPGGTLLLRTSAAAKAEPDWPIWETAGDPVELSGEWQIDFLEGGPALLPPAKMSRLSSWTSLGEAAEAFAGTARYSLRFDAPASDSPAWLLDLGEVHQSARVRLNGREVGTFIQTPFRTVIEGLKPTGNVLEVEVTSVAANRIRDLDRRGVVWRTFHDINFVNIDYKPFDASQWPLTDSGLIGPVRLIPVRSLNAVR